MKYVSASKKGSCALGCMIVAVPVGIGWAVVSVIVIFFEVLSRVDFYDNNY